jgi:hypothetical protein
LPWNSSIPVALENTVASDPSAGNQHHDPAELDHIGDARDVLTPREVAERSGFSYRAILRAIERGYLEAFEPIPGQYRIGFDEYVRWLHTPARREPDREEPPRRRVQRRRRAASSDAGSFARLTAIEGSV